MKTRKFPVSPILVYVLGQVAWMALLGLWITWYVANVISGRAIMIHGSDHITLLNITTTVFVLGLVFLSALLAGLTLIFTSLNHQVNINRTYDNFIASVTHELKSPLASIRLHLETLELRKLDEQRTAGVVAHMERDADRLENLINMILEIARLEHLGTTQGFRRYDADELVRRIVEQSMTDFRVPNWVLDVRSCAETYVRTDESAFKRIFDILIDNAVKYSPGEARLLVRCSPKRRRLVIEVVDRGVGIPKESLRKVFRKFYRVERNSSPNVKGTGLGLFWARELVRLHRGTITAESGDEQVGTRVRIALPLSRKRGTDGVRGRALRGRNENPE